MNCEQANKISLNDFLKKHNFKSVRKSGQTTFYYSPFREEKKPSFIVNDKNKWHDFGSGEHGTLVDFVVKWQNYSIKEALKFIENSPRSFSFQKQKSIEDPSIKIQNIRPFVKHKALLDYLKSRAINPYKVRNDICEIWYMNKKKYFGIGFKNDLDGYEVRNLYLPICVGQKTISTIKNGSDRIVLFEGFFDYLSYKMLEWDTEEEDYMVLNSVNTYKKAIPILKKYKKVIAYLDNDPPGKKCFNKIKLEVPGMVDRSYTFSPYKDLNEYLMGKNRLVR